ncbi:DUF805 domain-containing protein [Nocardioides sp. J2M5]|nr:DUF805 domain-containing protein [Nocardioides palaemonis]
MTAVKTCFSKYVDFNGRARRSEFWWWALFTFLVGIVAGILDRALGTTYGVNDSNGLIGTLSSLALLLPGLAVAARRLHDTGRSAWWLLLIIVVFFGWIVLFVFYVLDSQPGDNRFGPNPKTGPAGYDGGYPPPPPAYGSGQYGA